MPDLQIFAEPTANKENPVNCIHYSSMGAVLQRDTKSALAGVSGKDMNWKRKIRHALQIYLCIDELFMIRTL